MHAPARRLRSLLLLVPTLALLPILLSASTARASHEALVIDGDLTDLIQAVNDNLIDGGFKDEADALGEIYTPDCAFVNGFDIRKVYVLVDYRDAMGDFSPDDITLYAGWQVEGAIGDTDGDGDPDILTVGSPGEASGCATSDNAGIGFTDAYSVRFDFDCANPQFGSDLDVTISDGKVYKVVGITYTELVGATFAFDGSFLELKVPDYQALLVGLPVAADLCDARMIMTADSREDGPGEDRISTPFQLQVAPSIAVTKNPPEQLVCPGSPVEWTITVRNDGLCNLEEVLVSDTLGAGMTFESSLPASMGDDQVRSWNFTDLAPGDSLVIQLTAVTAAPCAAPVMTNTVVAEGVHTACRPEPAAAIAMATAIVNCRDLPPCDIAGPGTVCLDNSAVFSTTVTTPYIRSWSLASTPPGIANTVSPLDGPSITVNFTGAGVCTVSLTVRDPLDPEACVETCLQLVTVNDRPPCDIQGDDEACVGNEKVFRTTAGPGYDKQWSFASTPGGICSIVGAADLDSVVVLFTAAGTCTITVAISDPNDPEGCRTECDTIILVNEQPPCDITGIRGTDPITRSCVGDTLEFYTSVYPAYDVVWSLVEDPAGTCELVGPIDEGMVQVAFTGAGSCTLYLDVTDPADPELCASRCQLILTADPLPPCEITGPTEAAPGDTIEICTPIDGALYDFEWSVVSDPADICFIDGPVDGDCISLVLTGSGECTVTLTVTDPNNPDVCFSTCDHLVRVSGGFACPHTIGFWRQQCAQKGNGSTKVCLAGMQNLWRCVIEATGVTQWVKNDGNFETTASLAALSNSTLFDRLCAQLQGPRPMTGLDMAEIQYLGLMLNVCSGALPLNTPISNGFSGTVAEAIEAIEAALNTGVDLGYWKEVADDINNRIGVLAEDCLEGDDLFRNLPPCGAGAAPVEFGSESVGNLDLVQTRPFPNPVRGSAATIFYNIPARLGVADVSIVLFDVAGRAVRTLVSDNKAAGQYTVDWDLRDDSGSDVVSGIYFYRLTVGNETITEKMMVVRN